MEDGEGWEQLLAKIPWRCGRYSLVGRRRRKTEEKPRPHPLPKSEPLGKMRTSEEQFLQFNDRPVTDTNNRHYKEVMLYSTLSSELKFCKRD